MLNEPPGVASVVRAPNESLRREADIALPFVAKAHRAFGREGGDAQGPRGTTTTVLLFGTGGNEVERVRIGARAGLALSRPTYGTGTTTGWYVTPSCENRNE